MESEEIILATWGVSAGFGASATVPAAVGICEGALNCAPQARQNLSDGENSPPQDGQFMAPLPLGAPEMRSMQKS
jgi:hypothetical protein